MRAHNSNKLPKQKLHQLQKFKYTALFSWLKILNGYIKCHKRYNFCYIIGLAYDILYLISSSL